MGAPCLTVSQDYYVVRLWFAALAAPLRIYPFDVSFRSTDQPEAGALASQAKLGAYRLEARTPRKIPHDTASQCATLGECGSSRDTTPATLASYVPLLLPVWTHRK